MSEQTFSYPIDETTLNRLVKEYSYISSDPKNEYIVFFASKPKFSISIFINKKKEYKVVFQGELARKEASRMGFNTSIPKKIRTCPPRQNKLDIFLPQIGSDEVGFGDLFGPIIVASSYIDSALLEYITSLGVTDSKLLTDEKILEIGPKLISKVPYSELYLPQEKYNQIEQNGFNMNKIKAKMHNRVLLNLAKKYPTAELKIDQFASEPIYYSYLKEEKEIARPIEFSTKGELAFPSVAASSVIARYAFLKRMEQLDKIYDLHFPFGASAKVDKFGIEFVKKFGKEELNKVAKMNFANISRII
ncbi:MAG: ribonuclease HIII [Bacillales bacterium]|nr:ribonuclease HIII [Bacillales bacterium]MDD7715418.1 ribonuclease HIII [Mollicutes bacterium]MDY3904547.1 ribonuclease HIII [Candidatus Enteromonas sp.]